MMQSSEAASTAILDAAAAVPPAGTSSVVTRMTFNAAPTEVWKGLMFYEEIGAPPPPLLRMLLPVPIRIEGRALAVGDEARCLYEGGHLLKRLTRIEQGRYYGFDVAEQALAVGRGIRLSGGGYTLRAMGVGRTELAVETRYSSPRRPRWLWQPVETAVCHAFHRFLLASMRRKIEGQ
jgi:hypothetical protein